MKYPIGIKHKLVRFSLIMSFLLYCMGTVNMQAQTCEGRVCLKIIPSNSMLEMTE